MKLRLAKSVGFCYGVRRAVELAGKRGLRPPLCDAGLHHPTTGMWWAVWPGRA